MVNFPDIPESLLEGFNILCVIAGLGLIIIGLYFEKTHYEIGGLVIMLIGLVVSWYKWYSEEKESSDIDELFKFDEGKEQKEGETKKEDEFKL